MSPPGCPKMWVKPCNRNAEESFPVLSLKSREQKPPNPLLIQDKDVLQPSPEVSKVGTFNHLRHSWRRLYRIRGQRQRGIGRWQRRVCLRILGLRKRTFLTRFFVNRFLLRDINFADQRMHPLDILVKRASARCLHNLG